MQRNDFVAKFSGIWQPSTQKNRFNCKKCVFFKKKVSSERVKDDEFGMTLLNW